jgi:hypothetical protein
MKRISTAEEIAEYNNTHNTPSELMQAVAELSPNQVKTLAFDLIWKLSSKDHQKFTPRGLAKRAILEASMRPVGDVSTVTISGA